MLIEEIGTCFLNDTCSFMLSCSCLLSLVSTALIAYLDGAVPLLKNTRCTEFSLAEKQSMSTSGGWLALKLKRRFLLEDCLDFLRFAVGCLEHVLSRHELLVLLPQKSLGVCPQVGAQLRESSLHGLERPEQNQDVSFALWVKMERNIYFLGSLIYGVQQLVQVAQKHG